MRDEQLSSKGNNNKSNSRFCFRFVDVVVVVFDGAVTRVSTCRVMALFLL